MPPNDKNRAKDRPREERLAAALRENLRRRKAQARTLREGEGKGGQQQSDEPDA